MTERKQALSGVLNLRVDEALSREIDRIAKIEELRPAKQRGSSPAMASK